MKVLHAIHHYWPCVGGMEFALMVLAEEQAKHDKVKVVCLNKCAKGCEVLRERESKKNVEIFRLPFIDLKLYKIASSALRHARNCDVIHVHGLGFFSDFFLLTKPLHKKKVVIGSYGGVFHTGSNPLKWFYFNVWNRVMMEFADKVVAISDHDVKLYREIAGEEKIEMVPVPVELEKFKSEKKKPNSFIFVGRLSKNKRVDLLLEAFAESNLSDWNLKIVGDDFEGLKSGLEKKAVSLGVSGNVEFLGRVVDKEMTELLSESEFFVSASDYESFGISAVEAMASGCIPILSPIDSFKSFLQNEENGFTIDFHKPKKAGSKIFDIVSLPDILKRKKKFNAINYVKVFLPEKVAAKLKRVYGGVLK